MPYTKEKQMYNHPPTHPYHQPYKTNMPSNGGKLAYINSWVSHNWMYLAGIIGVIILICLGLYIYNNKRATSSPGGGFVNPVYNPSSYNLIDYS